MHRWLLDGWPQTAGRAPRIEEDLSFVPKDREEVIYVYMYRVARNEGLKNPRRWRPSQLVLGEPTDLEADILYERAPLYLYAHYLIAVHSRFRSEAERLLGWAMMRLNDASHLIYRPRKYMLPSGGTVDSLGRPWSNEPEGDVEVQKVSLAMVDDLTVGDAINFFTIHEAPYRPFVTYRAACAMRGALVQGPPTTVAAQRPEPWVHKPPGDTRPNGRLPQGVSGAGPKHEDPSEDQEGTGYPGPPGFGHRPIEDSKNPESED